MASSKTKMIEPGTLLLTCEPLVYVGKLALVPPLILCDTCLVIEAEVKRCASCHVVNYCSATCQKKGWKDGHRYECKQMPQLIASLPSDCPDPKLTWMSRLLVRLIVKLQDGKDYYDVIDIGGTKVKRRFQDLMSNCDQIQSNETSMLLMRTAIDTAKAMLQPFPKIKLPDDVELFQACGRIYTNSHVIGNHGFDAVGNGLYLGFSVFSHACKSTATRVFDGATMLIRNIVEIPKSLPLDKVTVSYINSLAPTQIRRQMLKDVWCFHCECEMCETGDLDREMRSVICPKKKCKAEIDTEELKNPCSACGHVVGKEVVAKMLEAEMIAHEQLAVDDLDLKSIEDCIKKLKSFKYTDKHWLMLKLLDRAHDLATVVADTTRKYEDWKKAYDYASKYLMGLRRYLQQNNLEILRTVLALSFSSYVLSKVDEAVKYISEARSIAEVVYGKDSEFIRTKIDPDHETILSARMYAHIKQGNRVSNLLFSLV